MSYLDTYQIDLGAESQEDATMSVEALQYRADKILQQITLLAPEQQGQQLTLLLDLARVEMELKQSRTAWNRARAAFSRAVEMENWESAVIAGDILFRTNEPDGLIALGHALWLGITFPVDPALTVAQLRHVIAETPEDSDGAAVAAAVAAYVVELRAEDSARNDLTLVVSQMLNDVARRHGNAHTQAEFDRWFSSLELDQPAKFIVRMRNIIDVLVQDQWWIDRDALQQLLPEAD